MEFTGAVLLLFSFGVSAALTPAVRRWANRIGLLDEPSPRKVHNIPMPRGGGLAIVAGTLAPIAAGVLLACAITRFGGPRWLPEVVVQESPRVVETIKPLLLVLAGGLILVLVGLIHD